MLKLASAGVFVFLGHKEVECWVYRDDIGAWWGIKGYEDQVTEVGSHHGHMDWSAYRFMSTWDSGSVRRGFQVFARNCGNCHGMFYRKYDFMLDKAYKQLELASAVSMFSINPGHHHYKQYYYQEWDDRDRVITDSIYAPYLSQDQGKNANNGVWPTDLSKIRLRPGGMNYIYNILTGYNYKPPFGLDVPKGKYFNPYFDHMIIGMPRQLYDGMIDYDDGTPASTPQMAYDRRWGAKKPDTSFRNFLIFTGMMLFIPMRYLFSATHFRNALSYRLEAYAVRDGLFYNHFRKGQHSIKTAHFKGKLWN